jgi:hypothetical protein
MNYHFKGISFKPRNVKIERRYITSPKKTAPKQNLEYDGGPMEAIKEAVENIYQLVTKKYGNEKKN